MKSHLHPKIASGYFYDVYEVGGDKVLKKKRSFFEIAISLRGKDKLNFLNLLVKTFRYIQEVENNTKIIKQKLSIIPQNLLGNPNFTNDVDYTQDKVVLLMDYFDTHSLEENKIIVEKYTELIKELLYYGVHDYVYKFKNSYGLNNKDEVVFIDFNEVTFSHEKVIELVQKQYWKNEAQFKKFPEGDLKNYIKLKLCEVLTLDNVETSWKSL